jgi:hypothetical protein
MVTVEAARYGWAVRLHLPPDVALVPLADLCVEFDGDDRWDSDLAELAEAQRQVRTCHLGDYRDLLDDDDRGSWDEVTDAALARRDDAFRPFAEVIAPLPTLDLSPEQARDVAHALLRAADQVSPLKLARVA